LLSYLALDSKTELKLKPTKDNEIDLTGEKDIGKRYYRALYAKLLSDDVTTYFSIFNFFYYNYFIRLLNEVKILFFLIYCLGVLKEIKMNRGFYIWY
jgi:hypothetical protein